MSPVMFPNLILAEECWTKEEVTDHGCFESSMERIFSPIRTDILYTFFYTDAAFCLIIVTFKFPGNLHLNFDKFDGTQDN